MVAPYGIELSKLSLVVRHVTNCANQARSASYEYLYTYILHVMITQAAPQSDNAGLYKTDTHKLLMRWIGFITDAKLY